MTGGPVAAFANPAAWALSGEPGFDFWWSDRSVLEGNLDNWGLASGKNLGFAMQRSAFRDLNGDRFAVYTRADNLALIRAAFQTTPFLRDIPEQTLQRVAGYPETLTCEEP